MNLLNDKLLHTLNRVLVFKAKVELGGTNRLISRVVPNLEIGVIQGLLASNTLRRVEIEHSGQEVYREGIGMGDKGGERNPGLDWKRANVFLGTGGANTAKSILGWGSQIVQDLVELIDVTEEA